MRGPAFALTGVAARRAVLWRVLAAACLGALACGRPASPPADDVAASWSVRPAQPVAGLPAIGEVRLRDRAGHPVRGAAVSVEAHMAHPGMAPVLAAASERPDGVYEVALTLSMAGDWIVLVKGTLPDGRRLNRRFDIANARPPR